MLSEAAFGTLVGWQTGDDHKVVASKEEWDYFQRLHLVLKSDVDIVTESGTRHWTVRKAVRAQHFASKIYLRTKTGIGTAQPRGLSSSQNHHRLTVDGDTAVGIRVECPSR